jgi:phosphatidylglycerol:prolipoprotein diacylglycerol transferase
MLAVWLHNIDPFAIQITETFGLRWYGLAYLTCFIVGALIARRIARVGLSTLGPREITDFVISVAIAVLLGGRLGYVLFYKPELFIKFDGAFPWWGVLRINEGGMSSHGGMIGVGLMTWWYAHRSRRRVALGQAPRGSEHSWLHLFDIASFSSTIGFFFGRIANFINAELIGRPCDPKLPWAVKFPQDMHDWIGPWLSAPSPQQTLAQEHLEKLAPLVEQVWAGQAKVSAQDWLHAVVSRSDEGIVLVERTIPKLIHAIQDGGPTGDAVSQVVAPLLITHHPSQIYAALLEGLFVFLVLAIVWLKPRKPGVISGLFGVCYGIARIIGEFYRTPDAFIQNQEFEHLGLTRGQLLSIALTIAGLWLLWYCSRRNVAKLGGLLPVNQTDRPAAAKA